MTSGNTQENPLFHCGDMVGVFVFTIEPAIVVKKMFNEKMEYVVLTSLGIKTIPIEWLTLLV